MCNPVDYHHSFSSLYPAWGKEKLLSFCRALAANKTVWKRGQTAVIAEVAAGEYPAFCGAYISSALRLLERDPGARLATSIPTEVPVAHFATLGILTAAEYPNAALLLAGWLASPEGQKQYKIVHRDSPLVEDTLMAKRIRAAGGKVLFVGWQYVLEQEPDVVKWIVDAWGLPTGRAKKKAK